MGLLVDGIVGPVTWATLRAAHLRQLEHDSLLSTVRGFDERVDLDVVMLQQKLQLVVGPDCVEVDGVYGPRTEAAVRAFIAKQGLSMDKAPAEALAAQPPSTAAFTPATSPIATAITSPAPLAAVATPSLGPTPTETSSASHPPGLVSASRAAAGGAVGGTALVASNAPLGIDEASPRAQLTPLGEALLRESYLSELEAKALHKAKVRTALVSAAVCTPPRSVPSERRLCGLLALCLCTGSRT